jgi:hypothetical protein
MCIARLTCHWRGLLLVLLLFATPARADDLADFNAAVEAAMAHHRVALGYLRTGNIDLAAIEIDDVRAAWGKVATVPRPAIFRNQERYTGTMLEIAAGLVGTTLVLNMGRADIARESLEKIRASLSALRRENGVTVLADCVLDANTAMDALFAHDKTPDWNKIASAADAYRATLQRCDGMVAPNVKSSPEFRRLIDGAFASLAQFPKAIETRDGDLLHRLLIELRSFDNLLAFRYG